MRTATNETEIVIRAKAFTGCGIETVRCIVDANRAVRVHDSVAGYYTTCHALSAAAIRRIRRLAAK